MHLKFSSPSAPRQEAAEAAHDEEAERIRHLVARTTEARQMLAGLLSNLSRLEAAMVAAEPFEPLPGPAARRA